MRSPLLLLLALGMVGSAAYVGPRAVRPNCRLSLTLVDDSTGEPISGVVRIRRANGAPSVLVPRGLAPRGRGLDPKLPIGSWYVVPGRADTQLPPEKLHIEAIAGIETEQAAAELDLEDGQARELRLAVHRFSQLRNSQ